MQLFAVSNHHIPPHRNLGGKVRASLLPADGVLGHATAFVLSSEMAVWRHRTTVPPEPITVAEMPGARLPSLPLTFYSWSHVGSKFCVQMAVWLGERATADDVATFDAVLRSISFEEAL
jgi:hypothetical protein